jgi:hypothetical protein
MDRSQIVPGKLHFQPFDQFDWMGYAGATRFLAKEEPLLSLGSVKICRPNADDATLRQELWGDEWTVILDGTGIGFHSQHRELTEIFVHARAFKSFTGQAGFSSQAQARAVFFLLFPDCDERPIPWAVLKAMGGLEL